MSRIVNLAAALAFAIAASPAVATAEGYDDYYEPQPLALYDVDKHKCKYFPDLRKDKYFFLDTYKVFFDPHKKKLYCIFYDVPYEYFEEQDGFKCLIAKKWRFFKRTHESEFEPKRPYVALLTCDFDKRGGDFPGKY